MTELQSKVEIALSKQKIVLLLLGAIVLVALGLWFVIAPPQIENSYWGNPVKIKMAGYASILFFGMGVIFLSWKLRDNKPGLVLDDTGFIDNSAAVTAGKVLWIDIIKMEVIEIQRQRLIMIYVKNPQDYIDRQTSGLKKRLLKMNYSMYGTPLSISANGLKISFDELFSTLANRAKVAQQDFSGTT
jgi:hypothetical protein